MLLTNITKYANDGPKQKVLLGDAIFNLILIRIIFIKSREFMLLKKGTFHLFHLVSPTE